MIFEAKNYKKFDKMELSWPTEMVDSLNNQKKLFWNDIEKIFLNQKIQMVQNSQKQYFFNQKMAFLSKKQQKFDKTEFAWPIMISDGLKNQ